MNQALKCRYTGAEDVEVIYEGPMRSGGADSGFEEGFRILRSPSSDLVWLDPFPPQLDEYYESKSYWSEHHGGSVDIEKLRRKLYHEQLRWLNEVTPEAMRGKCVADFGCGSGIFFDLIAGVAKRRVGIDLASYFKPFLEAQGHEFVAFDEDLGENWVDVALCFDTLEHTPEPWKFLKTVHRTVKPSGDLYIGLPNQDDFLKQLVPAYLPFFYHRSHLWYFTGKALSRLVVDAGFEVRSIRYVHKYDLMNMIAWARDGRGIGKVGCDLFDVHAETAFRDSLERMGIASHVLVHATKID